jgi:hypothetical protein
VSIIFGRGIIDDHLHSGVGPGVTLCLVTYEVGFEYEWIDLSTYKRTNGVYTGYRRKGW